MGDKQDFFNKNLKNSCIFKLFIIFAKVYHE